jgi:thiamine biosynthesis protein ThiS
VTIELNGEPFDVRGPVTISALLDLLEIDSRRVAVEHNMKVIKRDAYPQTTVQDRDQVEIVNFVGGG